MSREDIEAGLSHWLDEPEQAIPRAELERLIRASPELGLLRADWERLTELLRVSGKCPGGLVDWDRLRRQIVQAVPDPGIDPRTCKPGGLHSPPCTGSDHTAE